ncbi:phosphoribulokinase [Cryptosporangium sp. NPDC051539]|uniref:phosphoribulokinase n=1 Tax=Cryptosporangium sp. NPDC051539 TaxID=3363962 RepID=UPI0037B22CA2
MLEKIIKMTRSEQQGAPRPVMLAIAGDSASGKTTLTKGLVEAVGPERCLSICVDDYHRYDREERRALPFTPLHPDCNYIDIMEQHLQLLALGRPILKPVYDHATGRFTRPQYVEPKEFVIIEGLHPLSTKLTRACFDVTVYLDPPEPIRRGWKVDRDCRKRGYTEAQVLAELERREPESQKFIRPQRRFADIVVRFAPIAGRDEPPGTPLSAELLLRPTIKHPALSSVLTDDHRDAIHLKIMRDQDGTPTDCLHVHGPASQEEARHVEKAIWEELEATHGLPERIGEINPGDRSEPLAITQLILLYHLLQTKTGA